MKTITVFTPTYNRAELLKNAYESLKKQTVKDFEWLIVDDGSTDDTKQVVESFISEKILDIKYIYQENRGQYFAHNTAAKYAESELFTFLDSDDVYLDNTIEILLSYFNQIKLDDSFAGIAGLKAGRNGKIVGGNVDYDVLDCTVIDFRYKYKYKGDKLESFRTSLIKQFLFPIYEGKYVPNALIWNRISNKLKIRYFAKVVEYYELSSDSMSYTIIQNRRSTPDAYLLYYSELSKYDIPFYFKLRSAINFWRFAVCSKKSFKEKLSYMESWKNILAIPLGYLCYYIDNFRIVK